jgi:nicotinamide mononucleotide (NMN) deamidase PncC
MSAASDAAAEKVAGAIMAVAATIAIDIAGLSGPSKLTEHEATRLRVVVRDAFRALADKP